MQATTPTLNLNQDLADTQKFMDSYDSCSQGEYEILEASSTGDKRNTQETNQNFQH